jgi:hypothetical protein
MLLGKRDDDLAADFAMIAVLNEAGRGVALVAGAAQVVPTAVVAPVAAANPACRDMIQGPHRVALECPA